MEKIFSEEAYNEMIGKLFVRFPSFQKVGAGAYKPGIGNMEFFDQLAGHPHRNYRIVHIAGTNGKGSVSNMLASCLSASGLKVGLYTSPHILDFRERIRMIEDVTDSCRSSMISEEYVWSFVNKWQETFDHLDMSFFEITTSLALSWFADMEADVVVLETGLGGRLDSTNIVSPVLSIITNIGLDHCDMLGDTVLYLKLRASLLGSRRELTEHLLRYECQRVYRELVKENYLVDAVDKLGPEELAQLLFTSDVLLALAVRLGKSE